MANDLAQGYHAARGSAAGGIAVESTPPINPANNVWLEPAPTKPSKQQSTKGASIMAWIPTISEAAACDRLRAVYERVRQRSGKVPNIAKVQSLRPTSMERGFDLYCQLMDDPTGLSKRERVLIATVVSKTNGCLY